MPILSRKATYFSYIYFFTHPFRTFLLNLVRKSVIIHLPDILHKANGLF
nr:MAG TPA: hypothetical protein [Caudoviricetes sp.]